MLPTFSAMKQKAKKIIFFSSLVVLLAAVSTGFYLFNKGPVDVENSRGIAVSSSTLYESFIKDSTQANKKYTGSVVNVTGEISKVSLNSKQQKVVLLKTGMDGGYVNCTLEGPSDNINTSGTIHIKGICSGIGEADADLGILGDVYLTRCFLSN